MTLMRLVKNLAIAGVLDDKHHQENNWRTRRGLELLLNCNSYTSWSLFCWIFCQGLEVYIEVCGVYTFDEKEAVCKELVKLIN